MTRFMNSLSRLPLTTIGAIDLKSPSENDSTTSDPLQQSSIAGGVRRKAMAPDGGETNSRLQFGIAA